MSSKRETASSRTGAWRGRARVQLLAVVLGVLPLYSTLVILQGRGGQSVSLHGFTFYLAVISPLSIAVALLLLRYLCGESPQDLNLRPGRVSRDLLATLVLSALIIVANVLSTNLLSGLFRDSASNSSVRDLFVDLTRNPKLLVLFLVLLVPLGAAAEEVVRAFLLSRLWKVWPSIPGKLAVVVASACVFGLTHLYHGVVHATWAGVFGLIMALYYFRFGRLLPLVLAHYVTNAFQVVVFAARLPR